MYNIYPTLLDSIQRLADCDQTWEKFWGNSDEPSKTQEEYYNECRQELLDKLNRKPSEPTEAADKGTCFNEIIDLLQEGRRNRNEEMQFDMNDWAYTAAMHGFLFQFSRPMCDAYASMYKGAANQVYLEYTEKTKVGDVHLYGYADKVIFDQIIDLKTTSKYEVGKYEANWQRYVYSLALHSQGVTPSKFRYDVFEWRKGTEPLEAAPYCEEYVVNIKDYRNTLVGFLENIAIPVIESMRGQLTDTAKQKLFGE